MPIYRNVLALVKDDQSFLYLYDDDDMSRAALLLTFLEQVADREMTFEWYDAATLSQRVRLLKEESETEIRCYDGENEAF